MMVTFWGTRNYPRWNLMNFNISFDRLYLLPWCGTFIKSRLSSLLPLLFTYADLSRIMVGKAPHDEHTPPPPLERESHGPRF